MIIAAYWEATERRTCEVRPWRTWRCCLVEEGSGGPWLHKVRTRPWCCSADPTYSPTYATWLSDSETRPRTEQEQQVMHMTPMSCCLLTCCLIGRRIWRNIYTVLWFTINRTSDVSLLSQWTNGALTNAHLLAYLLTLGWNESNHRGSIYLFSMYGNLSIDGAVYDTLRCDRWQILRTILRSLLQKI